MKPRVEYQDCCLLTYDVEKWTNRRFPEQIERGPRAFLSPYIKQQTIIALTCFAFSNDNGRHGDTNRE